jgi:murein DD-endopeptidase MepM/ murein hydrolase activator NlpD
MKNTGQTNARPAAGRCVSCSACLALLLFLALMFKSAPAGAEEGQSKADYLRTLNIKMDIKKRLIKQSQSRLQYEKFRLSVVNKKEQDLSSQLSRTESNLWETEETIRNLKDRRVRTCGEIGELKRDLEGLRVQLNHQQKLVEARLRDMYMNNEASYFAVVLESENFSDFINRLDYFQRIIRNDTTFINEVQAKRKKMREEKERQEVLEAELKGLETENRKKQVALAGLKHTRGELLAEVKVSRDQIAGAVYELETLTKELETQLQDIIRQAQAYNAGNTKGPPIRGERNFMWPVRGFITSNFGYRVHPIRGTWVFHSGIDIAAMYGASINAASSGIVIYSGWYGGYGNTLILDHGNGYSTLYAHCSTLFAVKDQRVKQGSTIASVGSTGMSTGPHLHFEIRQNGVPIDPRGQL